MYILRPILKHSSKVKQFFKLLAVDIRIPHIQHIY